MEKYMDGLFEKSRQASVSLGAMDAAGKNALLLEMASLIEKNASSIIRANEKDVVAAKAKMTKSELDRLSLSPERLKAIAGDVRMVASLRDPVGEEEGWTTPNGLRISRVRVPFGVIGAIYENRPNVTVDIASLCLKSGNACILRGSASALNSNRSLVEAIRPAFRGALDGAVQFVDTPDRSAVEHMMKARGRLDLLIPRGGPELIQRTVLESKVPVIETGTGNCHVFVDESADLGMAKRIILNAKCQRPSVCNAEEKLLVHRAIAGQFIPEIAKALREKGVEIRADAETLKLVPDARIATEEDWPKEYLDLIIAIKVVGSVDEAIAHINRYNSKHTEAIVTKSYENIGKFTKMVDAAAVMVNASTRFTDGGQFGFGAEVGISTQKLHARGPMGLRELTTYKYVVQGSGHIRE
ncbi:MAG TPA: glutamate-5-semialdehyde dehydrogenase [Candidatus Bilamarchaeum sp.]|nr:glutamate-5-semialdehyde dehydrogenase [Candidatus Bilamarchaeum sp.]